MAYNTTPDSEEWDYFYYTNYPQSIRTSEQPMEIPPYHIGTFADIVSSRSLRRCIGRKGSGLLADQCKVTLSHNIQPTLNITTKMALNTGSAWTEAESLVKLARSCLCEQCYQTQLSDVVVAWIDELENPVERPARRADCIVDEEKMGAVSRVGDIAPVKSLVAASVATRDLVGRAWGFWS